MDFKMIAIVLVIILFSMILHELAHGVVAFFLGDTTAKEQGRLTINPLKHIDPVISVALPLLMFVMGGPVFGGAKPVPVKSKAKMGAVWYGVSSDCGPINKFFVSISCLYNMLPCRDTSA